MKKFYFLTIGLVVSTTPAFANVKGLSSSQLANFAQNQSVPQYINLPQGTNQSIPDVQSRNAKVSSLEKDVILMQLDMLRNTQSSQNIGMNGFSTVKLTSKKNKSTSNVSEVTLQEKPIKTADKKHVNENKYTIDDQYNIDILVQKIKNNEIDVEQLTSKLRESQKNSNAVTSSNLQANNLPSKSDIDENDWMIKVSNPSVQKKPVIQRASFVSPQVQQSPYNYPSQAEILGNSAFLVKRYTRNLSRPPLPNETQYSAHGPATIDCVLQIAQKYDVPAHVLLGIQSQERGKNGQAVLNKNGSYDMGHFQINTIHFRKNGVFAHVSKQDVLNRGCYNAELAAWLLKDRLSRVDYSSNFWKRAAAYHSFSDGPNRIYMNSIMQYSQQWFSWLNARQLKAY